MSKLIRVPDHLFERIKGAAESHYRSPAGEIEFMMDLIGGINGARDEVSGTGHWTPTKKDSLETPTPQKITAPKTFDLDEIISGNKKSEASASSATTVDDEMPCCKQPLPCKHWSWDTTTGEGYVNSLSGRIREA